MDILGHHVGYIEDIVDMISPTMLDFGPGHGVLHSSGHSWLLIISAVCEYNTLILTNPNSRCNTKVTTARLLAGHFILGGIDSRVQLIHSVEVEYRYTFFFAQSIGNIPQFYLNFFVTSTYSHRYGFIPGFDPLLDLGCTLFRQCRGCPQICPQISM